MAQGKKDDFDVIEFVTPKFKENEEKSQFECGQKQPSPPA